MDVHVEQDIEIEEGTAAPKVIDEAVKKRGRKPKRVATKSRDNGLWKFRPWNGLDHWVHEKTGASTFDLKNIK